MVIETTFCFVSGTSFLNFSPALVTPRIDAAEAIEFIEPRSSSDFFWASLIKSGFDCCFLKLFFFSSTFLRILSLDLLWKESLESNRFIFLSLGESLFSGDGERFSGDDSLFDGDASRFEGDGPRTDMAGEGSRFAGDGVFLSGEDD